VRPRTLEQVEGANLALISTPGTYAAGEALKALKLGLHVFLLSDNVSVEEELILKQEAGRRGLLVMGPDCGTAIINGVPLGFANAVRPGRHRPRRRFGHRQPGDLLPSSTGKVPASAS